MKYQEDSTYVQCTCGNIFRVKEKLNIDALYVNRYCPCCGDVNRVLNIGNGDILDKYLYYDPYNDERYYNYD